MLKQIFYEDMVQFLTLVDDSEEEEHEEAIGRLYQCLDRDDTSSSDESSEVGPKEKKTQIQEG